MNHEASWDFCWLDSIPDGWLQASDLNLWSQNTGEYHIGAHIIVISYHILWHISRISYVKCHIYIFIYHLSIYDLCIIPVHISHHSQICWIIKPVIFTPRVHGSEADGLWRAASPDGRSPPYTIPPGAMSPAGGTYGKRLDSGNGNERGNIWLRKI